MKNGTCPKCGGTNVRSGARISGKGGYTWSNTIPLGGPFTTPAPLDNYVCLGCGYVESYISNRVALTRIREKWPKASKFRANVAEKST